MYRVLLVMKVRNIFNMRGAMNKIKLWFFCLVMGLLYRLVFNLYNWLEDRRPSGGFHVRNYRADYKPWRFLF